MRRLICLFLILSACAKNSDPTPPTPTSTPAFTPIVAPPTPVDPPTPLPTPIPTPTPVPTPVPVPTAPTPLSCFNNGSAVFCTGANLGTSIVSLDLNLQFGVNVHPGDLALGGTTITMPVQCANFETIDYYHPGTEVAITTQIFLRASGQTVNVTLCGNAVTTQNTLELLQ